MRTLYPQAEPYAIDHLAVSGGHRLYVEQCGNPDGLPVVFLHGGPGAGCKPYQRGFFSPLRYRAILIDQRGAGRSAPQGEVRQNTTQHLLQDLEQIRERLGIDRWLLFGGSWGAALALLYAQQFPERALGLVVRGTFLARGEDIRWFVQDGANRIYPESWQRLVECVPAEERADLLDAIGRRLEGTDELAARRMAREWNLWSSQVVLGEEFDATTISEHVPAHVLNQARVELHYARHRYFIEEGRILSGCVRLADVPAVIVHGRRDLVCPPEAAVTLHRHLPHAELRMLPEGGHISASEPMIDALVTAADEMAERLAD